MATEEPLRKLSYSSNTNVVDDDDEDDDDECWGQPCNGLASRVEAIYFLLLHLSKYSKVKCQPCGSG